ncbi:MAG TPA: ABC transporter ATP-binding protein, partial [Acidimicrobiia bacterium]
GPSGSGKSTTIHLVAALDRHNSGRIVVHGRDIAKHHHHIDRYRREGVGVIFQLHNLLPHLSVLQNVEIVMLGTKRHRQARVERAHELLESVGLAEQAGAYPPELSGGERQRVAVARAFANDPPLVLADEPTNSLDDDTAAAVIELLRDRCRSGGTVLAVSHDQRLTRAADRVLRLADGQVTSVSHDMPRSAVNASG